MPRSISTQKVTGLPKTATSSSRKLNAQEYGRYLIGIAWRKRRMEFLWKFPWCEECYAAPATQAHHLSYAHLGNEHDSDLAALCRLCHMKIHGIKADNDNQPELPLPAVKTA